VWNIEGGGVDDMEVLSASFEFIDSHKIMFRGFFLVVGWGGCCAGVFLLSER